MKASTRFPHDITITVMRSDGTLYKCKESHNLMNVHKWSEAAVRVQQLVRHTDQPSDQPVTISDQVEW